MATVFPVLLNWLCALFLFGALGSRPLTERSAANDAGTEDTCSRQVPPALQDLIRKRFPSMRMPSSSDIAAANRIGDLHDGGTGCTAVAEGDFDGDNLQDVPPACSGDSGTPVLGLPSGFGYGTGYDCKATG